MRRHHREVGHRQPQALAGRAAAGGAGIDQLGRAPRTARGAVAVRGHLLSSAASWTRTRSISPLLAIGEHRELEIEALERLDDGLGDDAPHVALRVGGDRSTTAPTACSSRAAPSWYAVMYSSHAALSFISSAMNFQLLSGSLTRSRNRLCCSFCDTLRKNFRIDAAVARPVLLGVVDRLEPLLPEIVEVLRARAAAAGRRGTRVHAHRRAPPRSGCGSRCRCGRARAGSLDAPQEVVIELLGVRRLERVDLAALRVHAASSPRGSCRPCRRHRAPGNQQHASSDRRRTASAAASRACRPPSRAPRRSPPCRSRRRCSVVAFLILNESSNGTRYGLSTGSNRIGFGHRAARYRVLV